MLTNCFSFAPRDSVPGIIAKICKYLKAHPGWSIEELKEVIGDIETSLAIGEVSYFTNQSINDLNILELYDVGYRFVFIGGEDVYGVMYALEKSDDNVFAKGISLGVTASEFNQLKSVVTNLSNAAYTAQNPPPYPVTKVNGKAGEVSIDLPDVLGESTAQTMLMTRVNFDSTELATWNAFYDNGYRIVGVISDDRSSITSAYILGQNEANHAPIPMAFSSVGNVLSVNGDIGEVFTLRVDPNDPGVPTDPPVPINATTLNGKSADEYLQKNQVVNNFTTTEAGFVADARALKILDDKIGKPFYETKFDAGARVVITFNSYATSALIFAAQNNSEAFALIYSNGYLSPIVDSKIFSYQLSADYKTVTINNPVGGSLYTRLGVLHLGNANMSIRVEAIS